MHSAEPFYVNLFVIVVIRSNTKKQTRLLHYVYSVRKTVKCVFCFATLERPLKIFDEK